MLVFQQKLLSLIFLFSPFSLFLRTTHHHPPQHNRPPPPSSSPALPPFSTTIVLTHHQFVQSFPLSRRRQKHPLLPQVVRNPFRSPRCQRIPSCNTAYPPSPQVGEDQFKLQVTTPVRSRSEKDDAADDTRGRERDIVHVERRGACDGGRGWQTGRERDVLKEKEENNFLFYF